MRPLLFVYGSLRPDLPGSRLDLLQSCQTLGPAQIRGRLYMARGYPALLDALQDRVQGQLLALRDHRAWGPLDAWEGCAEGLYRRLRRTVYPHKGRPVQAWVYLYGRSLRGCARIDSGDYGEWLRSRGETESANACRA